MRITIGSVLLAGLFAESSNAFVPSNLQLTRRDSSLSARYVPPTPAPPPIPPPPPEKHADVFDNLLQKLSLSDSTAGVSTNGGDMGSYLNGLLSDLSSRLDKGLSLPSFPDKFPEIPSFDGLNDLKEQFLALDRSVIAAVDQMAKQIQDGIITDYPKLSPYMDSLKNLLAPALQSPSLTILVSALLTYTVVSSVLSWDRGPPPSQPYPAGKYDPIAARAYFDNKLHLVVGRGLEILVQSLQFGLRLLQDKIRYVLPEPTEEAECWYVDVQLTHGLFSYRNNMKETEYQRGKELAQLLTRLGPTFIKGMCALPAESAEYSVSLIQNCYVHNCLSRTIPFHSYRSLVARLHSWTRNTTGPSSTV